VVIAGISEVDISFLKDSYETSEKCLKSIEQSRSGEEFMEDLSDLLGRCKLAYEASWRMLQPPAMNRLGALAMVFLSNWSSFRGHQVSVPPAEEC
jgi:hypothetical protein